MELLLLLQTDLPDDGGGGQPAKLLIIHRPRPPEGEAAAAVTRRRHRDREGGVGPVDGIQAGKGGGGDRKRRCVRSRRVREGGHSTQEEGVQ